MKVGLMGAGFMGQMHGGILGKLEGVECTALLEQDAEKASRLAGKIGGKVFSDPDSFFREGDFEVVDICLPTHLHEPMIVKSLGEGKHVLCEKPLTLSVKSAERIRKAVHASGLKFMVAQVIRFWPQYRKLREMIGKGDIGLIESVYAYRLSETPRWATWFRLPEKGGGALFDLHIHDLDFVYTLCGKPKSLFCAGSRGEFGAWDSVSSVLSWKDKHAVIQSDWKHLPGFPFQFGIRVRGSKGALEYRFQVTGNVESKSGAAEQFLYATQDRVEQPDCSGYPDGYEAEIRYFLDCVKNDKPVEEANINQVLSVLELVEQEKASLEKGERRRIM
jgi:predicted dehydrogenase